MPPSRYSEESLMQKSACVAATAVVGLVIVSLSGCCGANRAQGQPATQPAHGEPLDMDAMMANWQKAMTPGPEHAHLAKSVGIWDGKIKMWMAPDAPAQESTGTSTFTSIFGGRYLEMVTKGEVDMGNGKMPLEGRAIYGYDNVLKRFESVWIDNMGTGFMKAVGQWRADGKGIDWVATMADPMTGKMMTAREVETVIDDDHTIFEMYGPGPDGKEFKTMEIHYTRRK